MTAGPRPPHQRGISLNQAQKKRRSPVDTDETKHELLAVGRGVSSDGDNDISAWLLSMVVILSAGLDNPVDLAGRRTRVTGGRVSAVACLTMKV